MPEARLELARLASEVFETSASTIPPLGPAKGGLAAPAGGVNGPRQGIWTEIASKMQRALICCLTPSIRHDWQSQRRNHRSPSKPTGPQRGGAAAIWKDIS